MRLLALVGLASIALCGKSTFAQPVTATVVETPRLSALQKMPIREMTVFKDGHAFVLHEGTMPTDGAGNVALDYLPTPVVGTFWAYSNSPQAKLNSVVASPRRTLVERTALNLRELLEANVGAQVVVTEQAPTSTSNPPKYSATILAMPQRSSSELEFTGTAPGTPVQTVYDPQTGRTIPVQQAQPSPQKGDIVLLQTDDGVKALGINQIRDVTFKTAPRGKNDNEEWRNLLQMKLNWQGAPRSQADVGLMYLQKGVRWIPSYRVTLSEKNIARVELQATLINELTDFQNATLHLVIGVPSFAFKDTPDPISLQSTFAQLSQYFYPNARDRFSNAIMAQGPAGPSGPYGVAPQTSVGNVGPEVADSGKNEDLFLFTVKNVSLKKGERLVMPIAEYSLPYKDIYTLDLPFAPPSEAYNSWNTDQQRQVAQYLNAPRVQHKIRLVNKSTQPLTTAPALIINNGKVLAQGMMKYTAAGGDGDLEVTSTVDVRVTKNDTETKRTPKAAQWNGYEYQRVDVRGLIELCSYRKDAIDVEVTRYVLGNVDVADRAGKVSKVNVFEDTDFLPGGNYPEWWRWGDWGNWWHRFNGVSRIKWTTRLEPEKEVQLNYTWHYFWR